MVSAGRKKPRRGGVRMAYRPSGQLLLGQLPLAFMLQGGIEGDAGIGAWTSGEALQPVQLAYQAAYHLWPWQLGVAVEALRRGILGGQGDDDGSATVVAGEADGADGGDGEEGGGHEGCNPWYND